MTSRKARAGVPSKEDTPPPLVVADPKSLLNVQQFNSAAVRMSPYWIVAHDEELEILNWNDAAMKLFGNGEGDPTKLLPPAHCQKVLDCFRTERTQGMIWEFEGKTYEVAYRFDGQNDCVIVFGHEVTSHVQDKAALRHQLLHDPLTGLPNRTSFEAYVEDIILSPRRRRRYGVMLIDIDHFKPFNDDFESHAVGDRVLIEIGRRLQEACRGDMVARLHGEEFAFVAAFPGDMDDQDVRKRLQIVADKVMRAIRKPIQVEGMPFPRNITVSIGIAIDTRRARKLEKLLDRCDRALYAAKEGGRNRFLFFDPTMMGKRTRSQS
jgi:diguanylate cyclase (GGDEF)-like protein